MQESRKPLIFAAALFAASFLLHAFIDFRILPPTQLVKYTLTAREYLQGKVAGERLLDFSPLYLRIHIIAAQISSDPVRFMNWIHILLISLSCSLLFLFLRRFFPFAMATVGAIAFMFDRTI